MALLPSRLFLWQWTNNGEFDSGPLHGVIPTRDLLFCSLGQISFQPRAPERTLSKGMEGNEAPSAARAGPAIVYCREMSLRCSYCPWLCLYLFLLHGLFSLASLWPFSSLSYPDCQKKGSPSVSLSGLGLILSQHPQSQVPIWYKLAWFSILHG